MFFAVLELIYIQIRFAIYIDNKKHVHIELTVSITDVDKYKI